MKYDINQRSIIYDYENLLLGRTKKFSEGLLDDTKTLESRRKIAGTIWNYAITHYLGWTAKEADLYMTSEIAEKLLLNKVYKRIDLDPTRVLFRDFRFILQYAFPGEIKYDIKEEAISEYERTAKIGKWRNNTEFHKYPKKFFLCLEGEERANILLNYVVSLYMGDLSSEMLYDFFFQKAKAKKWLVAKNLGVPLKQLYEDEPLEYFHTAIDDRKKDDFFYYNNKIRIEVTSKMNENSTE